MRGLKIALPGSNHHVMNMDKGRVWRVVCQRLSPWGRKVAERQTVSIAFDVLQGLPLY